MEKNHLIVFGILIVLAGGLYAASRYAPAPTNPQKVSENNLFANPILPEETTIYTDNVVLYTPSRNANVSSPLTISGKARGSWFFEASFPISLLDSEGNILGQGIAQAQGDWMTSDFVPFTGTITFTQNALPLQEIGTLVLQKDNPSGLPEHDDSLRVPVILGE